MKSWHNWVDNQFFVKSCSCKSFFFFFFSRIKGQFRCLICMSDLYLCPVCTIKVTIISVEKHSEEAPLAYICRSWGKHFQLRTFTTCRNNSFLGDIWQVHAFVPFVELQFLGHSCCNSLLLSPCVVLKRIKGWWNFQEFGEFLGELAGEEICLPRHRLKARDFSARLFW